MIPTLLEIDSDGIPSLLGVDGDVIPILQRLENKCDLLTISCHLLDVGCVCP